MLMFSVELPSLRSTGSWSAVTDEAYAGRLISLPLTEAFDHHQDSCSYNVIPAVNKVLQGHQVRHLTTLTVAKWALEHCSIVAVLVDHDVTASISLRKE
jgi:hypothetical protein